MSVTMEQTGITTWVSGVTAAFASWGLSMPNWAVLVSAAVAVAGFGLNAWATLRRDRREERRLLRELEGTDAESRFSEGGDTPHAQSARKG